MENNFNQPQEQPQPQPQQQPQSQPQQQPQPQPQQQYQGQPQPQQQYQGQPQQNMNATFVNNINIQQSNISDKDWLTTLLLLIFVGTLGVHRFYVGKIGTGFLYIALFLCTCGIGNIIWWIVDLIAITGGNFTDASGRFIRRQV